MIEIDRLPRFHLVGHRSLIRRRRRRRLAVQKLGPVPAGKLGVATATRRCAAVSAETVAANTRRSILWVCLRLASADWKCVLMIVKPVIGDN